MTRHCLHLKLPNFPKNPTPNMKCVIQIDSFYSKSSDKIIKIMHFSNGI